MTDTPHNCRSERRAIFFGDGCSGSSEYALNDLTLPYLRASCAMLLTIMLPVALEGSAQFS